MCDERKIKTKINDSVFCNMFREKKYLLQLYCALHPEDTEAKEKDIENVTLNNVLTDGQYNDLGFNVRNVLIVLVEAQSKWSINIIIRAFMYLAETYRKYIDSSKQDLYTTKKLVLPKPELYVIYTGSKEITDEYVSFKNEFLDGMEGAIDIKVKILTKGNKNDIIYQYITFCKVAAEQVVKHGKGRKALEEIIRICSNENILKEYLETHRTEVLTIMEELFDQEAVFEKYVDNRMYWERVSSIKKLMKNMKWTIDQAFAALGIEKEEQDKYRQLVMA